MCRDTLSRPVPVAALVGRYPTNKLIGHGPIQNRLSFCPPDQEIQWDHQVLPALSLVSGTEAPETPLFLCSGYVIHVFLTRPPLTYPLVSRQVCPLDLHALTTPPAFDLSQDQTLRLKSLYPNRPRLLDPDGSITTDLGLSFFASVRMKAAGPRKSRLHCVLAKPTPIRRRIGERWILPRS